MAEDNFLRYTITFLKLAGIYPVQTKSRIKIWLFYIWRIIMGLAELFIAILSSINIAKKRSVDFTSAVESIVFFGFALITMTRTLYMIIFWPKGFKIIEEMKLLFREETNTGLKEKSLKTHVSFANRLTFFWAILSSVSAQCLICTRLIFNSEPERIFPLPLWFPEEWKASPYYEFTLVYQCFVMEMNAIIAIGIDSFVVSIIIYTCAQFDMLGWECKCLLHKVLKHKQKKLPMVMIGNDAVLDEAVSLQQLDEILGSQQVRVDMLNGLNDIVSFHQLLLDFCKRFNEIVSPVFLSYFLFVVATLMFISLTIITTNDITGLGGFILYFACVSFTLFLPCYFGNLLTTQAEHFLQDLYDSPWYVCDEMFKRNLKLMQLRARRPLTLSIGKFGALSLSVFLSVMQSTMSYALVFRKLMEEK